MVNSIKTIYSVEADSKDFVAMNTMPNMTCQSSARILTKDKTLERPRLEELVLVVATDSIASPFYSVTTMRLVSCTCPSTMRL